MENPALKIYLESQLKRKGDEGTALMGWIEKA
jgi:hypothetical protein